MTASFNIESFDPEQSGLLGAGLWGRVYDLGDGTVLKLARESCAGIGSGGRKVRREYAALHALAGRQDVGNLLPVALGTGEIAAHSSCSKDGFAVWLRTTKKTGNSLSAAEIGALPPDVRAETGRNIGRTLARLHAAMAGLDALNGGEAGDVYGDIRAVVAGDPFYLRVIERLERERADPALSARLRIVHGDFNITNLLFDGAEVCAVLDFAEWGPGFPEKDISDIAKECPDLAAPMMAAYAQETGYAPLPHLFALGLAENALYGAVIGARNGDSVEEIAAAKAELSARLEALDGDPAVTAAPLRPRTAQIPLK